MNKLLSIPEVSEILQVKVNTIYDWVHQRKIPFIKVGRLVRFDPQEMQAWINENRVSVFKQ